MKKSTLASLLVLFVLIPLTLFLGTKLPGRSYYLTSTLIVIYLLIPFLLAFEGRKPQARELVLLAVMCALAVASRVAIPIPHFKPIYAVIMLCGIAFGAESGFLVGALSALVSNFFSGQGPYTPWQMLAYGTAGLLAGFVANRKWIGKTPLELGFLGFFSSFLVVSPILDTCSVFVILPVFSLSKALPVYISGIPMNLLQSACTAVTMLLFGPPLLKKLDRIKTKYGILETGSLM